MTQDHLALLLRALALEAKLLRKLLSRCAAAGPLPASISGPWMECAINDLQKLASRAEGLAEFVVLDSSS
jgi:hypothetical protein